MRDAEDRSVDNGVSTTYLPGNPCMMQRRDQKNAKSKEIMIKNVLFADDTTKLGENLHIEEAKSTTKKLWFSSGNRQTKQKKSVW